MFAVISSGYLDGWMQGFKYGVSLVKVEETQSGVFPHNKQG